MMTLRLEVMVGQNPPHGGSGDVLNNPLRDELVRQFDTIPPGETAAQRIRALACQAHNVDRDLRGGKPPLAPRTGRLCCLCSDQVSRQRVNEHVEGGKRSGVRGTPTFFVNNAWVDGSCGFDRVVRAVAGGRRA